MKSFTLSQLAEGIHRRSLGAEAPRLLKKWSATGLLEGLKGSNRDNLARLFENQAAELLKEQNTLSLGAAGLTTSGQVVGFTNVAFPIVRRVFAGLIANEIVSVQPMSLPTGLLFYLDYSYGSNVGGNAGLSLDSSATSSTYTDGQSVYNNPRGSGIRSGSLASGGQYDLVGTGFSKVHKGSQLLSSSLADIGYWASGSTWTTGTAATVATSTDFTGYNARYVNYDAKVENDLTDSVLDYTFMFLTTATVTTNIVGADLSSLDQIAITGFGTGGGGTTAWGEQYQGGTGILNLRKLNRRGNWSSSTGIFTPDPLGGTHVLFVLRVSNTGQAPSLATAAITGSAAISDSLSVNADGATLTIPSFESNFAVDASPRIPEVDIRIESTSVTATTRKLRARWSPEMAQDLTAFYSIDIEVELTNILSEMITLDIDREILNDLLTQAGAANLYWSRAPGKIVNKYTGAEALQSSTLAPGPMAFVNVQEWYQTLIETVSDAANTIYKKTLRGSANFLVTSPDVCTILEHLVSYKPAYRLDSDGQVRDSMTIGAESVGTLNNRYTVYKDPYFPSNKILLGLKGNTFLESGYIYAPYVPLILTPVIYAQEDFTPRKGVMTRYGKRMVRNDFYATVTVLDMNLI
ncbi:MAG: hypothetical protein WC761_01295 [Candidatus Paceibacterota bacterium]|jgi:hypothetical protein